MKFFPRTIARAAFGPLALLLLGLAAGCEQRYAEDLRYSVRTDPLVLDHFTANPAQIDAPGDYGQPGYLEHLQGVTDEEKQKKLLDPNRLKPEQRQQLDDALVELFGTPREPRVTVFKDVDNPDGTSSQKPDPDFNKFLKLDEATLARGSEVYRAQCLHCHGLTGDARGPTAAWINPHPRDFRRGKFKFISVKNSDDAGGNERKPRREDLLHELVVGLEGTSMPSFALLGDDKLNDVVSYVIHLSIRGEVEYLTIKDLLTPDSGVENIAEQVKTNAKQVAEWWRKAEANPIIPGPYKVNEKDELAMRRSVQHGFQLFQKKGAGCISCHIDYGRQGLYFYDDWGTIGRPADLTNRFYHGGRRPIDLYYRIHSGINGSNMPGAGKQEADDQNGLKPDDIWDLVNFLETLPYPTMRQKYGIDIDHPGEEFKVQSSKVPSSKGRS